MSATSFEGDVLVVRANPSELNRNIGLFDCVLEAFVERLGKERAHGCSAARAEGEASQLSRGLVLVFGSVLPDECDYLGLADVARRKNLPLAFWLTDDPYEFDAAYKFADIADLVFTNDLWTVPHYRFVRKNGVYHLPLAASVAHHYREVLERDEDYLYDVFFCGVGFENRRAVLEGLRPILSQVDTLVCGAEWGESLPFVQNRRLTSNDLMDAYQHSRVVLNLGRNDHYANSRLGITPSTPGPRTFEAAVAGACQLVLSDRPEILDYYELDREIILFDGAKDAAAKLERLLERAPERMAIARAAQRRTTEQHLYVHRIDEILRRVQDLAN